MTRILPLVSGGADPAPVADNAIIYSKVVSGVTQAFITASDGSLTQISSVPTGTFLGRQVFTAGGTYTPTAGTRMVRIRMVGGGGGGGAKYSLNVTTVGGGGAGGMYVEKTLSPGVAITGGAVSIGAGGAGGDNATGGTGGDTTIVIQGTTYTAKGGLGGTGANYNVSAADGGAGQSQAQTVDIQYQEPGAFGFYYDNDGTAFANGSGKGGGSPLGSGGASVVASTAQRINGNPGQGYGGGGSGAIDGLATGDIHAVGGAGAPGLIIVDEYAQAEVPAGMFLGRQIFTANGTYTPTLNTRKVRVRMVGGGGGGGGGVSTGGVSGGGASGAYFELTISPGALITGGAVTIGAAGAGSGSGSGGTGGDSSIVVQSNTYTAKGGLGGGFNGAAGEKIAGGGSSQPGTSAGDFSFQCPGRYGIVTGTYFIGGDGGDSPMGAGGKATSADTGENGQGYGGGGGGCVDNSFGCVGGNGTAGLVIVEEYTG